MNNNWCLMYEGPRLSHMFAKHIFLYPYLSKKLERLVGYQDKNYLWYSDSSENIHGGFYNKTDMKNAKEKGNAFFKNSKKFKNWINKQNELHKKIRILMNKYQIERNINKIKEANIISLIPNLSKIRSELFVYVLASQPQCTEGLSDELKSIINSKITNSILSKDIFIKLSMPEKKLFFTYEELEWLDIIIKAKRLGINKYENKTNKNFLKIYSLVKKHHEKYFLLPASDRTETWNLDHFIRLFNNCMKSNEDFIKKRKLLISQYKNIHLIKKNLTKKYNLPYKTIIYGTLISKIGYYRFLSSFYGRWIGYYLVMICRKYAKKTEFTFEELSSCEEEELISIIKKQAIVTKQELENRVLAETILIKDNKIHLYFGEMAKQIKLNQLKELDYNKITKLRGEIANLGKVTGKAFVFYWKDNINKKVHEMPKNSILIAPQTHPSYMPAIRKAIAFATDEGGITGHAAIVSREFGKPCVIGLHYITKVVKTGDFIELDGNLGVIKILKRA